MFVTADLSVSPSSGSYQSTLTFSGSTFGPNENVRIYLRGVGSAVLAAGSTDASGSFSLSVAQPQSPYGSRLFLGVGQNER